MGDSNEELRSAKNQQLTIVTGALTILVILATVARAATDLEEYERAAATVLMLIVFAIGAWRPFSLHTHIGNTRMNIDPNDDRPFMRGTPVPVVYTLVIGLGTLVAIYVVWR